MADRPFPKSIFLDPPKRLLVRFYTSNLEKFLQAKTVLESYGIGLQYFKTSVAPYAEHYELGKEKLLAAAIDEVKKTVGRTSIFFVEDTSLRIEHLSRGAEDYPGLSVKEWFAKTTFRELDQKLPRARSKRGAVVKSDIALHIPGLASPVFFHGETTGVIAESPPKFPENAIYPWLTPRSFNGWFIPEGSEKRLGEMPYDASLAYDFRVKALTKLVERLEEYASVLNLPQESYRIVSEPSASQFQQLLFPPIAKAFVVVGPACAGKTTFGHIALRELGDIPFIEASNVVRSFRTAADAAPSSFEFAERLLRKEGYDVVAKRLIEMYRLTSSSAFVITGFRTIEELETIRARCPHVRVVLVEAAPRIRYARQIERERIPRQTFSEFLQADAEQWSLGLLRVAEDFADVRIINEGTLDQYRRQVLAVLLKPEKPRTAGVSLNLRPQHSLRVHRLFRCLSVLDESDSPMTCAEIANNLNATARTSTNERFSGKPIPPNNVNKVLKAAVGLALRDSSSSGEIKYAITDAGRSYRRLMKFYDSQRE